MTTSTSYILRMIAERTSPETARALVEHFGGTLLIVPGRFRRKHSLVKKLGEEMALDLIRQFSGERLTIPKFIVNPMYETARKIDELDDGTRSVADIAREVGVTVRTVYSRRRKTRACRPGTTPRSGWPDEKW